MEEMPNHVSWEKYFKMLYGEKFTQISLEVNFY